MSYWIGNKYYFDCWGRDGEMKTVEIDALNKENAIIIFKAKHPEMKYDEPYT